MSHHLQVAVPLRRGKRDVWHCLTRHENKACCSCKSARQVRSMFSKIHLLSLVSFAFPSCFKVNAIISECCLLLEAHYHLTSCNYLTNQFGAAREHLEAWHDIPCSSIEEANQKLSVLETHTLMASMLHFPLF